MLDLSKKINSFVGLIVILPTLCFGGEISQAAEKYAATVEDGTAKVIKANAKIDANEQKEEFLVTPTTTDAALKAPANVIHEVKVDPVASQPTTVPETAPQAAPILTTPAVSPETVKAAPVAPKRELNPIDVRIFEKKQILVQTQVEMLKKTAAFDTVPQKHVAELAERLKYANDILKRFGRAYDYRTTTLKDFKRILADLEATEENAAIAN